jgi:hypothetical protein
MRLTTVADDKAASSTPVAVELQNISAKPLWPERLVDNCRVEAMDTSGKRLAIRDNLAPPGPWVARKAGIRPGETLRWTEWYDRYGIVWPAAGDQHVRIRFIIPLRHARADEPELSVSTNWLALPTPKPHEIASEGDLPAVWGATVDLVYLHNQGGLSPSRCLHIDGQGRARLVRPAWGHEDKVVPFGRYQTRLAKEQLEGLLRLFREQRIWLVDKAVQPPLHDGGELDFSLVAGGNSLVRRYPADVVARHAQLAALEKEMERLMAKVVEQAKLEGTAFPAEFNGSTSRVLALAWARLVAQSTDKVTGGMRGVAADLVARQLNESHPTVLSVTAEEEMRFNRNQFPDAENGKLLSACAERMDKQRDLPEMSRFLIDKFHAGKLKGDELEVARRFLQASSPNTPPQPTNAR